MHTRALLQETVVRGTRQAAVRSKNDRETKKRKKSALKKQLNGITPDTLSDFDEVDETADGRGVRKKITSAYVGKWFKVR